MISTCSLGSITELPGALIYVFKRTSKEYLQDIANKLELDDIEIKLAVGMGPMQEGIQDLLWNFGFEYTSTQEIEPDMKYGVGRIIEALENNQWPEMTLKSMETSTKANDDIDVDGVFDLHERLFGNLDDLDGFEKALLAVQEIKSNHV